MLWPERRYRSGTGWCFWRWTDVEGGHLRRLHLLKTPLGAICLHWLFAADPDRDEHDHPVNFLSIVLRGAYVEVCHGKARPVTRFNLVRAKQQHRIIWAHPTTLTFCLMGPKVREWGFHTPGGWVAWRDYYRSSGEREAALDADYGRTFAKPEAAPVLRDLERRFPEAAAEIRERLGRMRERWRTGSA